MKISVSCGLNNELEPSTYMSPKVFNKKWFLFQICAGVKDHPELCWQIYTPHRVVVPGGRFRELCYWWVNDEACLSAACLRGKSHQVRARRDHSQTQSGGPCWGPTWVPCADSDVIQSAPQQGLLLGHQRAPAVRDDRHDPWDDSNFLYLVNRYAFKHLSSFIALRKKGQLAAGSSAGSFWIISHLAT